MPPSPSPPRPPRPPPAYKHFCRVCNKGFTCGSALGGHMRAHGVGDDGLGVDDDNSERAPCARGGVDGPWDAATHVYALRANPNRLIRSYQVCKNCGKEFPSMELLLEHGKCSSGEDDDATDSLHSSPPSIADGEEDPSSLAAGWSKGKRTRRGKLIGAGGDETAPSRCPSGEEEEDLANCLVMLSASKFDQASVAEADQESCASASKEYGKRPQQQLQPFSSAGPTADTAMVLPLALPVPQYVSPVPRGMFECKACKKVFTSHQALGGHRASHKKVKGCFAAKPESSVSEPSSYHASPSDPNNDKGSVTAVQVNANAGVTADARTNVVEVYAGGSTNAGTSEAAASLSMAITSMDQEPPIAALAATSFKKKGKMHECSVCHRLFSSGQALGGHKRCHWLTSSGGEHPSLTPLAAEGLVGAACHQLTLRPLADAPEPGLDLTIAANPLPAVMATARLADIGTSSLHLDAPASLYLQPSALPSNASHRNKTTGGTSSRNVDDAAGGSAAAEDEADSTTVKKARLSDLKDVSTAGETTPWLQVGIGSSSTGGDGKNTMEAATINEE